MPQRGVDNLMRKAEKSLSMLFLKNLLFSLKEMNDLENTVLAPCARVLRFFPNSEMLRNYCKQSNHFKVKKMDDNNFYADPSF